MAHILPFRALRYDPLHVSLADVLTQPYDKITPAMQEGYYARSPHNLIRFELGRQEPGDGDASNVYTRARDFLAEQQREAALALDPQPSIYAYAQRFVNPVHRTERLERRGFIALGRLHEYCEGIVHRHEQTHAKAKADRLQLLETTHTHSGQIFMLYEDAEQDIDSVLWSAVGESRPDSYVIDEYGVENRLWRISDPAVIAVVTQAMHDKRLIIADGHHRYETALKYRNGQGPGDGDSAHDYVMMTFVNMRAPGLIVLPTHRVVHGLKNFLTAPMLDRLHPFFEVMPMSAGVDVAGALDEISGAEQQSSIVLMTGGEAYLLRPRREAIEKALADEHPIRRKLGVVVLHKIIFERLMGMTEESIRNQEHIRYYRSAQEALTDAQTNGNAAFLLNAAPVDMMAELSYAGEVMPQKSTDFYPKLLSGLALYNLDQSFVPAKAMTVE